MEFEKQLRQDIRRVIAKSDREMPRSTVFLMGVLFMLLAQRAAAIYAMRSSTRKR